MKEAFINIRFMQKYIFFVLILSLSANKLNSQVDYNDLRSKLPSVCGVLGEVTSNLKKEFLDSVGQLNLTTGKDKYWYDVGMLHYVEYAHNSTDSLAELSKIAFLKSKAHGNLEATFNLAIIEYFLGDCTSAISYLNEYLENSDENNIDYKQAIGIYKSCWEER